MRLCRPKFRPGQAPLLSKTYFKIPGTFFAAKSSDWYISMIVLFCLAGKGIVFLKRGGGGFVSRDSYLYYVSSVITIC